VNSVSILFYHTSDKLHCQSVLVINSFLYITEFILNNCMDFFFALHNYDYSYIGSVSIVSKLRAGRPTINSRDFSRHLVLEPTQWVPGSFPRNKAAVKVKLNTHLYPVPRLTMRRAIAPLPDTPSWRGA